MLCPQSVHFGNSQSITGDANVSAFVATTKLHTYQWLYSHFEAQLGKIINARYRIDVGEGHGGYARQGGLLYQIF